MAAEGVYAAYERQFEQLRARRVQPAIEQVRQEALHRFFTLGFPTTRLEEWRFTSVAPIAETAFVLATDGAGLGVDALERFRFGPEAAVELVFVNGRFEPDLSSLGDRPAGLEAGSLGERLVAGDEMVEAHLARHARFETRAFTALNTAFLADGAFVRLAPGVTLERPVHLLFLGTPAPQPAVCHPRVLVVAGEHSQMTLVETYAGLRDGVRFTNSVTEIVVEPYAVVDHYRLVRDCPQAYHVGSVHVTVGRSGSLTSASIVLGGGLVRNDPIVVLDGEGGDCTLNGLYLVSGRRLVDNHTTIDHARPHCTSHELFKGILDGRGRAVFNGKIIVRPDAQKTDAKQTNKALLLSEEAQIHTKPELEIFADDVRCTHGATVGQLDAEALFYLRSRGLPEERARSMLIHAFAYDVVGRVRVAPIRRQLDEVMLAELPVVAEDEVCYEEPH